MEKETKTLLAIGAVGIVAYLLLSKRKPKTEQSVLGEESTDDPATNVAAPNNGYPLILLGAFESADPFAGLFVTDTNTAPTREEFNAFSGDISEEMPSDLALRVQQWVNAFNRIADPTLPLLDEDNVAGPATHRAFLRALLTRQLAREKYNSAGYDYKESQFLRHIQPAEDAGHLCFYKIHLPTSYNFKLIGFFAKGNIKVISNPLILTEAEEQAIRAAGSDINYVCVENRDTTIVGNYDYACVEGVYAPTANWKNGTEDYWNYIVPTNIGS